MIWLFNGVKDKLYHCDTVYIPPLDFLDNFDKNKKLIESNSINSKKDKFYEIIEYKIGDCIINILGVDCEELNKLLANDEKIYKEPILLMACKFHFLQYYKDKLKLSLAHENEITENILNHSAKENDAMIDQPKFIKLNLYNYQLKNIKWMVDLENKIHNIPKFIGFKLYKKIYYDAVIHSFTSLDNIKKYVIQGGCLFDDIGLGKTIQIITLSLLNRPKYLPYIKNNKLCSKATLIICPNHIALQWENEFKKITQKVKIIRLLTKKHFDTTSYLDLLDADYVIMSFNFLINKCYRLLWEKRFDKYITTKKKKDKKFECDINMKDIFIVEQQKFMDDVTKSITTVCPEFLFIRWHRIVVDEFHELFVNKKYSEIPKLLEIFDSNFRWIVTGTPFPSINSDDDDYMPNAHREMRFIDSEKLCKTIQFLTAYKYPRQELSLCFNNDIIFNNYIIDKCFRRNTKKNLTCDFMLKDITEEPHILNFTPSEKALYDSYLIDTRHCANDEFVRQICCYPKLANEIKSVGGASCNTIKELNDLFLKKYENDIEQTNNKINKLTTKIHTFFSKILAKLISSKKEVIVKETKTIFNKNKEKTIEEFYNKVVDTYNKKNKELCCKYVEKKEKYFTKLDLFKNNLNNNTRTFNFFKETIDKIKKIKSGNDNQDCCICLMPIAKNEITVTPCGHVFCYNCIIEALKIKLLCPICKGNLKEDELKLIINKKDDKKTNSIFYDVDSMTEKVGTKIAYLISYLIKNKDNVIIFAEWDELLHTIGNILTEYKIKNIFCRGNVYQCNKAVQSFNENDDIKIIMLSSTNAASGTNLTKANKIIFINPIYGDKKFRKSMEWQAIGRAYRLGQKKNITIIRLIIKDTIEQKIYNDSMNDLN